MDRAEARNSVGSDREREPGFGDRLGELTFFSLDQANGR